MADTNLTLMLYAKDDIRLEERPILEPGYGQVQLSMKSVGICGSDVHFWAHGRLGNFVLDGPVALGHEGSGVVTKLGPGVNTLKVGDRVAVEPATTCRQCGYCKNGRYNLCPEVKGLATPGYDGHLTRFFVHDADFCHLLPDNMSFEEGAIMEPMAVSVHVTNRAGVKMGENVLICGAGPIGLLCLLTCKARGVGKVFITDIDEKRLGRAQALGADQAINVRGRTSEDVVSEIKGQLGGDLVHVVLECSGAPSSTNMGLQACRPGGRIVLVGVGPSRIEIGAADASQREVDILGTFRYVNGFQPAIELVSSGKVDVKPLITHHFDLEEGTKAFEAAKSGQGIKIMINCDKTKN